MEQKINYLHSSFYPLQLPLDLKKGEIWKPYAIFRGATFVMRDFSCHMSVLAPGLIPHPLHEHEEEEILIILSGELNIIFSNPESPEKTSQRCLQKSHFAYYPANFAHTLENVGKKPANYLMFKWTGSHKQKEKMMKFGYFETPHLHDEKKQQGFSPQQVFEGTTLYLEKLHCHTTVLSAGAGYPPHADYYDVAILLLEGEVQTLEKNIKAPGVIFYAAGEPHGIYNPSYESARYLVFEFHGHSLKEGKSIQKKQIRFTHDAIEYVWDDVPEEKYQNWLLNTKDVLDTKGYTGAGYPFMLQIEPTSLCNLSCPLCPAGRHELNRPYRHMRFNEFRMIIDDMERYLLFLVLWDWGEPLMNSELPSMIRYASERGIQTVTSTNAHFLNNESYTEELLRSGLTTLIVAVDSLVADQYEIYRKKGEIDQVLNGLKTAVSVKKRIGSNTLINVRMVIMKQNEHEIKDVEKMARDYGADVFTVKSLNPSCGMFSQDEELLPMSQKFRRYEYIPNTYERVRTGAICRRIWTMSNIFSNGDVVPCCYDYDSEMKVGNIFETPFTRIWNSPAYRQLRKKIYTQMHTIAKCNQCGINYKLSDNGWIIKAVDLSMPDREASFSIIMPTYNRRHCIKNAINSLLNQNYKNFELIIIDDGSTDGTDEYLMQLYKKEMKQGVIKYFKLFQNKGAAFARNEGLKRAQYNWIGYLDTDNQMREDFLETFAYNIEKWPKHEIYYAQIKHLWSQSIIGHEFDSCKLMYFNFIDLGVFVHSKRIYKELGGFDVKLRRLIDWDIIIKYTDKYPPKFIEMVLLDYDDSSESSRITNAVPVDDAYKNVIINYNKRIPPHNFIERHTGYIARLSQAVLGQNAQIASLKQAVAEHERNIANFVAERAHILNFTSWKITWPLRFVGNQLKRLRRFILLAPSAVRLGGGLKDTLRKAIRLYSNEGLSGIKRGFRIVTASRQGDYELWIKQNEPDNHALSRMKKEAKLFAYRPKISIITPVWNTEERWLRAAINSVLAQTYENWELCIADGGSDKHYIKEILEEYSIRDARIKIKLLEENKGIAGNTNEALLLATGDFISFLDHDDELAPFALYEVVRLLNLKPDVDFIYSDEDKLDETGKRCDAFFKPDWSPDLLLSMMYTCHLGVYRKELVDLIGGLRTGFDGSQDYDFVLRFTEHTNPVKIVHISKILYHWRKVSGSIASDPNAKNLINIDAAKKSLKDALLRRGIKGEIFDGKWISSYRVRREISGNPRVSIIIPTRDRLDLIKKCIDSIINKTTYCNYELIIVDNNSSEYETIDYLSKLGSLVVSYPGKFNFSKIINHTVNFVSGDYLMLLNNDVEVISPDWVEAMLEHAQRKDVGAVGCKLIYPQETIQHAGVILGLSPDPRNRVAGHIFTQQPHNSHGYFGLADVIKNLSAVTAATMLIRKNIFEEVGGFDENLAVSYNDVDICLKIREKGYLIIYTPYAELMHHESISRGDNLDESEVRYMLEKWGSALKKDPYYNRNLSLRSCNCEVNLS